MNDARVTQSTSEVHSGNEELSVLSLHNQEVLSGRLRVNDAFTTFRFIKVPGSARGSESVLINRNGALISPSMFSSNSDTIPTNAEALQLLKDDEDSLELPNGKMSCLACKKTHEHSGMTPINANAKLICHKLLCTKLQQMYETEEGSGKTFDNKTGSDKLDSAAQRKIFLESDELSGAVESHRVWCKSCKKWIALRGGSYRIWHWVNHCSRSIHINAAQNKTTQNAEGKKQRQRRRQSDIWVRERALKADPLISKVERHQVQCKPCRKWIQLSGDTFQIANWAQHCKALHSDTGNKTETVYISSDEENGSTAEHSDYSSELSDLEDSTSNNGSPIAATEWENGVKKELTESIPSGKGPVDSISAIEGKIPSPTQKDNPSPDHGGSEFVVTRQKRSSRHDSDEFVGLDGSKSRKLWHGFDIPPNGIIESVILRLPRRDLGEPS